jgi:negative regulator of flagellin synthesis FlgM
MKIDHSTTPKLLDVEKAKQLDKSASDHKNISKQSGTSQRGADTVQISDSAKLFQKAVETANSASEVQSEKVADLKKRIKDGSYRVDAAAIADKLVDEHLLDDFGKNRL